MPPEAPDAADPGPVGPLLPRLARAAIAARLERGGDGGDPPPDPAVVGGAGGGPARDAAATLDAPGACFVTLTRDGRLRGCIGSLQAWRPLRADVAANAVAAATADPRFPPLTAAELADVAIEVSVLSAPEPLEAAGEAEAVAALRPGIDGIVLRAGTRRATFLPQVWAQLADPAAFLSHLRVKAGLSGEEWDDDIRLERYTVTPWREDPR